MDIGRAITDGIVMHATRGGRPITLASEYWATINWFSSHSSQCSAHRVIGYYPGEHAMCVADDDTAWHCRETSQTTLGIELAQIYPGDPLSEWQIACAAAVCARWCQKYGLDVSAITEHRLTIPGIREGKSDIGPPFSLAAFRAQVAEAIARLAP